MKKVMIIINIMLLLLIPATFITYQPDIKKTSVDSKLNYVNSEVFTVDIIEEVNTVETEETAPKKEAQEQIIKKVSITPKEEIKQEEKKEPEIILEEKKEEIKPIKALVGDKFTAKMSGYGSDIGDYTAYGYCIKDTIFYSDKTYGNLRILAAGYEYPFGTVIKIKGSKEGNFNAIVLDRGPNIGRGEGKKFAFDLLYKTSGEAYQHGVSNNVSFEVLRVGWK